MNTTLAEIINTGLNNPDCSFFVGTWTGQALAIKYLFIIFVIYVVLKALDKLAITPLLDYIKKKLFKQK